MIDIELRVVDCLRADADRRLKVDGLRERAVARAGTIRRRRRVAGAVSGAGLVAALTAAVVAAPQLMPVGGAPRGNLARPTVEDLSQPPPRPPSWPTTLPGAEGVPPAAEQPSAVGGDPSVLHFDVDLAALNGMVSDWAAGSGYERVVIPTKADQIGIEIYIGRTASRLDAVKNSPGWILMDDKGNRRPIHDEGPRVPTTVGGRPATLQRVTAEMLSTTRSDDRFSWVLRWQPVDGLYALVQVFQADKALAYAAAGAMRLDRAQRCVVPIRLTDVPAGATWTRCQTRIRRSPLPGRGVWVESSIELTQPDGDVVYVGAEDVKLPRHRHDTAQFKPNRTVAGYPAQWRHDDTEGWLWILNFGVASAGVRGASEAESLRLAGGMRIAADLADPETWPRNPLR